jgi:K+-transporting ATPase KdpF subunit
MIGQRDAAEFLCSFHASTQPFYIIFIRVWVDWSSHLFHGGDSDGFALSSAAGGFLRHFCGAGVRLPAIDGGTAMSWLYVLSGLVALAITVYLVIALLFPEKF